MFDMERQRVLLHYDALPKPVALLALCVTPRSAATIVMDAPVATSYRLLAGQVRHAPQDHIAVPRTDFRAAAGTVEYMRGGHRRAAAQERIEDDVARSGERLHKEL